MARHPLLVFPKPVPAEGAKRHGGGGGIHFPTSRQQAKRLAPQFRRLQRTMDRQRLTLQDSPLGLQPEQTLVLETIGPIQNFIKAVKKVQGLEWLGEFELEDIAPDYGFQDEKHPDKQLKGQLFLIMTDQQALQELQRLFRNWRCNSEAKFPSGLAPLKHAFAQLQTIRPWDAEDRIRDTGLMEDWKDRIEHGEEVVPFEVELWFRQDPEHQRQAEDYLNHLVHSLDGEVVQQCIIPEISYHGLLGRIPVDRVAEIIGQREVRLLQCEAIMHLRPLGQCAIRVAENLSETETHEGDERASSPQEEPVVALFDGLPLAGHKLLDGRLIIDDPDGYERAYQAKERLHGTAMATLICHGDLDKNGKPLRTPVYVRPIMQPHRDRDDRWPEERIPDGVLPVDLVHRAVRRLYEGEDGNDPIAPSVRVINLSVCDRSRPFDRGMSSWARLLDWLSWEYNVLFVVSAGNHPRDVELNIPRTDLHKLTVEERERAVIEAIAADTRHRRLLSPAETLNGLTVGAIHMDASRPAANSRLIDPFARKGLPSTISAHGPGYRRTIKPDIFLPGGRQFLFEKPASTNANVILQTTYFSRPPGQRVATPGPSGELDRTCHVRGTSNSAALASRGAARLFDVLNALRAQSGVSLAPEYDTVLLKTLLVHGADWADAGMLYRSILLDDHNSRSFTDYVGRFLGYGFAHIGKVMTCTDQRVTVLGVGALDDGQGHKFSFPLPPSLSAVTHKRRFTVTLAWLSPVNCARQDYRIAHLWFDPSNKLAPDRQCADWRAVQRGTVQHEVLEGEQAVDFQDGDRIVIKVNCRADAGEILEPIRYGLAVTLEVGEGIDVPIYQEVRGRLRVRVPTRGS